jgi:hypothetical protein
LFATTRAFDDIGIRSALAAINDASKVRFTMPTFASAQIRVLIFMQAATA